MEKDESIREYTEFKAPVTGWQVLKESKWFLVLIVLGIIVFLNQNLIPRSLFYGYYAGVTAFVTAYLYLGLPEGWALDCARMGEGELSLIPLNRFQLERMQTTHFEVMTFPTQSGTVALVGHRLISLNEHGNPTIHPYLELITNCEITNQIAKQQSIMIKEYLSYKRDTHVSVNTQLMEEITAWRKLRREDLEATN